MVGKREGNGTLESDLGEKRQSAEGSGDRGGLEMPAEQWGGEVCSGEEVEAARQSNSGKTVGSTANPGDLGTVDGKVGRDRAVQTLLGEDLSGIGRPGGRSVSTEMSVLR